MFPTYFASKTSIKKIGYCVCLKDMMGQTYHARYFIGHVIFCGRWKQGFATVTLEVNVTESIERMEQYAINT